MHQPDECNNTVYNISKLELSFLPPFDQPAHVLGRGDSFVVPAHGYTCTICNFVDTLYFDLLHPMKALGSSTATWNGTWRLAWA